jgi:16S rRNA G966 N2-methylase RsmD
MDRSKDTMSKDKNLLMKNSQKGLFFTLGVVVNVLKEDGIKVTISKIFKNIYHRFLGIDFSMQEITNLTIQSNNKSYGTICGSSAEHTVKHILDELVLLDKSVLKGTFVDYGSGKGRLIVFAKQYGFNKTIGIEFAKELCEITQKNIELLSIKNSEVLHIDAVEYIPKEDTRVIYFLNPFAKNIFQKVLPKIIKHTKDFKNDIYIIYRAPIYKSVFLEFPQITHIKTDHFRGDITEFYKISLSK